MQCSSSKYCDASAEFFVSRSRVLHFVHNSKSVAVLVLSAIFRHRSHQWQLWLHLACILSIHKHSTHAARTRHMASLHASRAACHQPTVGNCKEYLLHFQVAHSHCLLVFVITTYRVGHATSTWHIAEARCMQNYITVMVGCTGRVCTISTVRDSPHPVCWLVLCCSRPGRVLCQV